MPSRRYSRSRSSYLIEFFIIIAGIMVSFLLNEWRENSNIEDKKAHLLVDINNDLYTDSVIMEQMIRFYEIAVKSHDSLLYNRENLVNKDSLDWYLDHFTSYFPFRENKTSFSRILNDQQLSIDKEDSLIQRFMNLHNYVYPTIHEWLYIEKDFVLNKALPYMDENAPFVYPAPPHKSFDGSVFYELRKKDVFMNYLKSGKVYKESNLLIAKGNFNYIKMLKSDFNKAIQQSTEE